MNLGLGCVITRKDLRRGLQFSQRKYGYIGSKHFHRGIQHHSLQRHSQNFSHPEKKRPHVKIEWAPLFLVKKHKITIQIYQVLEPRTSKIRVYIIPYACCFKNSPLIHLFIYENFSKVNGSSGKNSNSWNIEQNGNNMEYCTRFIFQTISFRKIFIDG